MSKHPEFFEQINSRFPKFDVMMARLLVNSFGFGVGKIDASVTLVDFKEHHSETVAKSVATLLRKRKTAGVVNDAWRKQYVVKRSDETLRSVPLRSLCSSPLHSLFRQFSVLLFV